MQLLSLIRLIRRAERPVGDVAWRGDGDGGGVVGSGGGTMAELPPVLHPSGTKSVKVSDAVSSV